MGQSGSKGSEGGGSEEEGLSSGDTRLDIDSLGSGLRDGRFKNVVVMCGAGISTKAGVPDFRSPSAGLYFKVNVTFSRKQSNRLGGSRTR